MCISRISHAFLYQSQNFEQAPCPACCEPGFRKAGKVCHVCHGSCRHDPEKEPELTITPVGEPDFILTYKKESTPGTLFRWLKVILVCLATFFGAAFSIMTFNTDVDVGTLFQKIYFQVTGKISSGFTILEISYSIGLAIGVLFFFNHFSHLKFSADPTPMQVQMRKYEDDVNTTILEDLNREK